MYARINPFTGLLEVAGLEVVFDTVAPSPLDVSFSVPTLWIDTAADTAWLLLRISGGFARWALLATCDDTYPMQTEAGDDLITEAGDAITMQ